MNVYKVEGESRLIGAIGAFEPFIQNIAAASSQEAYNKVRESLYSQKREHVHIKRIMVNTDCQEWFIVEPRAYLA